MDFYAAEGNFAMAPLPFLRMRDYPYPTNESFPFDDAHINYLLEYNTRHMSGNEQDRGYWFDLWTGANLRGECPQNRFNIDISSLRIIQ